MTKILQRINLVYILSNLNKALAFEWISEQLNRSRFNLSFILLNPGDSALEQYLRQHRVKVYRIDYGGKKDLPKALWSVIRLLKQEQASLIHTHLFDASLIGLLAGKWLGIRKRVYTRHHATLHHVYFPRAVYYDRLINFLATDIVAISENVKDILIDREGVNPAKVHLIHHGFQLDSFDKVLVERTAELRKKYRLEGFFPVVGVIARYIEWKGIQYVIPAFQQLRAVYPNACLVIANATGPYHAEIQQLLQGLPQDNHREITFEEDIGALYQQFDVFVHTPIDEHSEAFGQTYVEALAAGIPSIFTLSGVAREFIQHGENAWVVPFMDAHAIHYSLLLVLSGDKEKINTVIAQGKKDVQERFTLQNMMTGLEQLYTIPD